MRLSAARCLKGTAQVGIRTGLQCDRPMPAGHSGSNSTERTLAQRSVRTCSMSRSVIQASEPKVSVMSARSGGLHIASHRRGVTPLVLFWNFSGHSSWNSRKMVSLMISEWMAATPLIVCDATTAKYAIRTNLRRWLRVHQHVRTQQPKPMVRTMTTPVHMLLHTGMVAEAENMNS